MKSKSNESATDTVQSLQNAISEDITIDKVASKYFWHGEYE